MLHASGPKDCALSGGRTGDGSCLGPVRPRPLAGPFGPVRAGALAPSDRLRAPGTFHLGPGLNPSVPTCPYGDWSVDVRRSPKGPPATIFGLVWFEVSVHPRHPESTRDAWRKAGQSYWPEGRSIIMVVRSSPILRCQAPRPASRKIGFQDEMPGLRCLF